MTSLVPLLVAGVALCFILGFIGLAGVLLGAVVQGAWRAARRLLGGGKAGGRRV